MITRGGTITDNPWEHVPLQTCSCRFNAPLQTSSSHSKALLCLVKARHGLALIDTATAHSSVSQGLALLDTLIPRQSVTCWCVMLRLRLRLRLLLLLLLQLCVMVRADAREGGTCK